MESKFIELTEKDGSKFFINLRFIEWLKPVKNGTSLRIEENSLPKFVTESYEEVKAMIRNQ